LFIIICATHLFLECGVD